MQCIAIVYTLSTSFPPLFALRSPFLSFPLSLILSLSHHLHFDPTRVTRNSIPHHRHSPSRVFLSFPKPSLSSRRRRHSLLSLRRHNHSPFTRFLCTLSPPFLSPRLSICLSQNSQNTCWHRVISSAASAAGPAMNNPRGRRRRKL